MDKSEFERAVRVQLERLVGQDVAKVVEAQTDGFINWWADGETPTSTAWLALESTGRVVCLAFADPREAAYVSKNLRTSLDPDTRTSTLRPGVSDEFYTVHAWKI